MDGFSLDIKSEQIAKLKALFPEIFSEEKIDWERLRATLGEDTFISNERYVLNWAGKSDAFKTLQTGTTATHLPMLKMNQLISILPKMSLSKVKISKC